MSKDGSAPEYRYFEFKEDVEASSSAAAQRKGWYCLNVGCNFAIGGRQPKVDKMRRHLAGNEELAKGVLSKSSLCRFSDDACKELFTGEIKRRLDERAEKRRLKNAAISESLAATAKRAKQANGGKQQQSIAKVFGAQRFLASEADDSIAAFFIACDIPVNAVAAPQFKDMLRRTALAGPEYTAPGRTKLGGPVTGSLVKRLKMRRAAFCSTPSRFGIQWIPNSIKVIIERT
jgi:hypothetical protein